MTLRSTAHRSKRMQTPGSVPRTELIECGMRKCHGEDSCITKSAAVMKKTMLMLILLAAGSPLLPATDKTGTDRVGWFRDAKFGLFIHWGLYSIPGGEWKGKTYPVIGEWLMSVARIPDKEYAGLAKQFNPVEFDAEAWAKFARDAGFRYIILTAKHHDGFALFKSRASSYNIVEATPFKRDIAAELTVACRKYGLKLGFYYSQAADWHEADAVGNTWDFKKASEENFDRYLTEKAEPQVRELLENYAPAVIWFDTPKQMTEKRCRRFVELVRSVSPDTLINSRLLFGGETKFEKRGGDFDFVCTNDNAIPDRLHAFPWETCITTNHTWGYKKADLDFKSAGEIIFKLVDTVSKGGNMLLNIGPDASGKFPRQAVESLTFVGQWLRANAEAIYGAGASPFGEEFGDEAAHQLATDGTPLFLPRQDWRCTTQPGKLFVTYFKYPGERVELPGIRNKILNVSVVSQPFVGQESRTLPFKLEGNRLHIEIGWNARYYHMAPVICIEYEGDRVEL